MRLTAAEISQILPHGPPFLFVDEAALQPDAAEGLYHISGREEFLKGHFKDRPVFPGSLMIESLGQLAVLHLLRGGAPQLKGPVDPRRIFFTTCDGVRCHRLCAPGETLELKVRLAKVRSPLAFYTGAISVNGKKVASTEQLALAFAYINNQPA